MHRRKLAPLALACVTLFSTCASTPSPTGFLSDYSQLREAAQSLRYIDAQSLKNYTRFIVEPVKAYSHAGAKCLDPEMMRKLTIRLHDKLIEGLSKNYQVVTAPGPGVGRVRAAITDIDASTPMLNTLPTTKLSGLGLGGASMEGELLDSRTGAQIAAVVQAGKGSRMSFAGMTRDGDARAVIDGWVVRFLQRLDEAHGR